MRLGKGKQIPLRRPPNQTVANLVGEHTTTQRLLESAPAFEGSVAHTHFAHHASLLHRAYAANNRTVRSHPIGLVYLVEVEVRSAEAVGAGHSVPLGHRDCWHGRVELGGQESGFAVVTQSPAQDLLAPPETLDRGCIPEGNSLNQGPADETVRLEAIDLSGVKERDAQLECAADDGIGFLRGVPFAVAPSPSTELVGAQSDLRDPLGGVDLYVSHGSCFSSRMPAERARATSGSTARPPYPAGRGRNLPGTKIRILRYSRRTVGPRRMVGTAVSGPGGPVGSPIGSASHPPVIKSLSTALTASARVMVEVSRIRSASRGSS